MSARWRMRGCGFALALLAAFAGHAAAQPMPAGSTVEHVLRVNGKQIALPEGRWVVAADVANDWNDPGIGAFGYVRTVLLFHPAGDRVDSMLEVNTNVLPTTDGWGMAAACARTDLVLAVVRYRAGWDGSCYFVTHTLPAGAPTAAWRRARDYAVTQGWRLSPVWLTAGFRAADRSDVLDVRFHFAPETRGLGSESIGRWQESAWMTARLDQDPQRYRFARAVSDWAVGYSPWIEAGLKNRLLTNGTVAMPQVDGAAPAEDAVARRLAELGLLRQAGTITAEEYAQQAKDLREHGLGSSSTAPDLGVVTVTKAVSYRIIVSISHIFVDYYWTGNFVAAGALEILQITINSTKFYFHELAWAKYMGIPRSDAARTLDFNYVGVNL